MPYLFVTCHDKEPQVILLDCILNIGRDPINDLVLPSQNVSRIHATIVRDQDDRYTLIDQNSTNGVLLNKTPTRKSFLQHGDSFVIAEYSLTFLQENTTALASDPPKAPASQDLEVSPDATRMLRRDQLEAMLDDQPESQPAGVGAHLGQLREKKGLSLEEISQVTRISVSVIKAIEAQDYHQLPADAFARPLIHQYADFLGADGPSLTAAFFDERESAPRPQAGGAFRFICKNAAENEQTQLARPCLCSPALLAAGLLLAIALSFSFFCVAHDYNPLAFLTNHPLENNQSMYEALAQGKNPHLEKVQNR